MTELFNMNIWCFGICSMRSWILLILSHIYRMTFIYLSFFARFLQRYTDRWTSKRGNFQVKSENVDRRRQRASLPFDDERERPSKQNRPLSICPRAIPQSPTEISQVGPAQCYPYPSQILPIVSVHLILIYKGLLIFENMIHLGFKVANM